MNASSTLNSNDTLGLRSQSDIKESEEMSRYLDKRVNDIDKAFTSLTTEFVGYARRTAKLRDNGDKIIEILSSYVCRQIYNSSTNECIKAFCNTMNIIEDLRNLELNRIKDHIIEPMQRYNSGLKGIKVEIKKDMDARKKELASFKKLEKSRSGTGAKEAKARSSSQIASIQAATQSDRLIKTVSEFEKQKLEHVQSVLRSFIHIEMLWHMRALERCSEAYGPLQGIDCAGDLNEFLEDLMNFRSHDHIVRSNHNLSLTDRRWQSTGNLTSSSPNRNELRTSVAFEDAHQRSKSFQSAAGRRSPQGSRLGVSGSVSQGDLRGSSKPPISGGRAVSRGDTETESEDETDTDASPSRHGPVPQKRGH